MQVQGQTRRADSLRRTTFNGVNTYSLCARCCNIPGLRSSHGVDWRSHSASRYLPHLWRLLPGVCFYPVRLSMTMTRLYSAYVDLHFAYLEINPVIVLDDGSIHYLDTAAKLDQTAEFIRGPSGLLSPETPAFTTPQVHNNPTTRLEQTVVHPWSGPLLSDAISPRRKVCYSLEINWNTSHACFIAYIQKSDASTVASLKLTVLNSNGHVWTMVAGGGASVVYADAIAAVGFAHELANYGEYSGAPSEGQTYRVRQDDP